MKDMLAVIAAIGLTVFCWGVYGPTLHRGQMDMAGSRLRPLLCVGVAYFVIAVVVPIVLLQMRGEKGDFTFSGTAWSLGAGAAGAVGALGIIMAFNYGGSPAYVMPMVFAGAPVVNAIVTIYLSGRWREASTWSLASFLAGLILVSIGAFMVLSTAQRIVKPHAAHAAPAATSEPAAH